MWKSSQDNEQLGPDDEQDSCSGADWSSHQPESVVSCCPGDALDTALTPSPCPRGFFRDVRKENAKPAALSYARPSQLSINVAWKN